MGRHILNYTSGREKHRQVSSFASTVYLFKKRISSSGGRRNSHTESDLAAQATQVNDFIYAVTLSNFG